MPPAIDLDIRGSGRSFAVFLGRTEIAGHFTHKHIAVAALRGIEARLRRATFKTRNCLCCETEFLSEGIHHRLCTICRSMG